MNFTVRHATAQDIDVIADFNSALARQTENNTLDRPTLIDGIRAMFEDPQKGFYLVAEHDGDPAGQLMITTEWTDWRNGYFWWIQSVYVHSNFRRRGVYTALYHYVEKTARARGDVRGIRLYVDRENTRAKQTYERLGMSPSRYDFYEVEF